MKFLILASIMMVFLFMIQTNDAYATSPCPSYTIEERASNQNTIIIAKPVTETKISDEYWTISYETIETLKGVFKSNFEINEYRHSRYVSNSDTLNYEKIFFLNYEQNRDIFSVDYCNTTLDIEHLPKLQEYVETQMNVIPPKDQQQKGLDIHEITCKWNKQSIIKMDDTFACVQLDSMKKLFERGWASSKNFELIIFTDKNEYGSNDDIKISIKNTGNISMVIPHIQILDEDGNLLTTITSKDKLFWKNYLEPNEEQIMFAWDQFVIPNDVKLLSEYDKVNDSYFQHIIHNFIIEDKIITKNKIDTKYRIYHHEYSNDEIFIPVGDRFQSGEYVVQIQYGIYDKGLVKQASYGFTIL